MSWTTANGATVQHAYAVAGLPVGRWTERDKHWITHYQHLEQQATRLDSQVHQLRAENARLQAENNFMLRLINNWENREKT